MSTIDAIIFAEKETWGQVLDDFLKYSLNVFAFPELNEGSKRKEVWKALYNIAKLSDDPNIIKNSFIAVRILSREKGHLLEVINDDWTDLMKEYSALNKDKFDLNNDQKNICIEVLKCFSNILFNSRQLATKTVENGIFEGLTKRIAHLGDDSASEEIKFMDMRLVFLITALCPEARNKAKHMIDLLIQILDDNLKKAAENNTGHENLPPIFLTDIQVNLSSEILKVLFNITIGVDESELEVLASCIALVKILRSYLIIPSMDLDKTWTLRNDVINLLTNMPDETYKYLVPPTDDQNILKNLQFEGHNMTVLFEILMCLKAKFNDDPKISNQHEVLSPIVTVLLKGATSYRPIRKFLRIQILPPLKDVYSRPEEGDALRNHLCRMLTTPITQLRDLVAELLFVLCKKNVPRMIKYTGYGNAAGLFAQKGLLAGGRDQSDVDYSSDSEDSETEEYADSKHGINPVIGCFEEPRRSCLENMSEEQKEFEAMKLVELMDSLMASGKIRPCVVGEDGKAKPVEHVLQLRDGLKNQQVPKNGNESD